MRSVNRWFFLFFMSALLSMPVLAQYDVTTETDISWLTGDIIITATAAIPADTKNLTSARFRITESIDRNLTSYVTKSFQSIYLDSLNTVSDGFTASQQRLTDFDALNLSKTRISSSMSIDLDSVSNIYKYNIFKDLVPLLIDHTKPAPVPIKLNYEPSANFSGIIIYASGSLPYYGASGEGPLQPSVFRKSSTEEWSLSHLLQWQSLNI